MQIDDILNVPDYENMSATDIVEYWSEELILKKPETRYTLVGLLNIFDINEVAGWIANIKATIAYALSQNDFATSTKLQLFLDALSTGTGPDFALSKTRDALNEMELFGVLSTDAVNKLKSLGFTKTTRWEQYKPGQTMPTEQEISQLLESAQFLKQWIEINSIIKNKIMNGELYSIEGVIGLLNE